MKNTYKNNIITIIGICALGVLPLVSNAASFVPNERTYYPTDNTQGITIVNNNYNYNTNTNTNTPSVVAPKKAPTQTKAPKAQPQRGSKHLCPTCAPAYTDYRLVKKASCGASIAIGQAHVPKPTCSLVPAMTKTGAIELQWRTSGATVAFIDNGIGHVNLIRGKRMVTPNVDTAYNLTVLNDAGIAGTCGARVNVSLARASEMSVLAITNVHNYALNTNQVAEVVDTTHNVETNTHTDTVEQVTKGDTDASELSNDTSTSTSTGLFGSTFKKVAVPIGIVFLLLIILLVVMMSKIKGAK